MILTSMLVAYIAGCQINQQILLSNNRSIQAATAWTQFE
jgi:hypothetical protein